MNHHGQTACVWLGTQSTTFSVTDRQVVSRPFWCLLAISNHWRRRHRNLYKSFRSYYQQKEHQEKTFRASEMLPTTSRSQNFQQFNLTYSSLKQQMEHPNFWISTLDLKDLTKTKHQMIFESRTSTKNIFERLDARPLSRVLGRAEPKTNTALRRPPKLDTLKRRRIA